MNIFLRLFLDHVDHVIDRDLTKQASVRADQENAAGAVFADVEVPGAIEIQAVRAGMGVAVAGRLGKGESPTLEAAVTKDLGNELEREIPEVLRRISGLVPLSGGSDAERLLQEAILSAPSFTLRGGTPEILRGIIARGLGRR